jgi:hypothetical protein
MITITAAVILKPFDQIKLHIKRIMKLKEGWVGEDKL